jgi:excisionase family DNA binding protein
MRSPVSPQNKSQGQGPDSYCGRTFAGKAAFGKPKFYTIDHVAEFLCLSPRSVRRLIDDHKLPVHRFGRAVRIAAADLHAFIAVRRAD